MRSATRTSPTTGVLLFQPSPRAGGDTDLDAAMVPDLCREAGRHRSVGLVVGRDDRGLCLRVIAAWSTGRGLRNGTSVGARARCSSDTPAVRTAWIVGRAGSLRGPCLVRRRVWSCTSASE
jgi:hypothetical protein